MATRLQRRVAKHNRVSAVKPRNKIAMLARAAKDNGEFDLHLEDPKGAVAAVPLPKPAKTKPSPKRQAKSKPKASRKPKRGKPSKEDAEKGRAAAVETYLSLLPRTEDKNQALLKRLNFSLELAGALPLVAPAFGVHEDVKHVTLKQSMSKGLFLEVFRKQLVLKPVTLATGESMWTQEQLDKQPAGSDAAVQPYAAIPISVKKRYADLAEEENRTRCTANVAGPIKVKMPLDQLQRALLYLTDDMCSRSFEFLSPAGVRTVQSRIEENVTAMYSPSSGTASVSVAIKTEMLHEEA